MNKFVMCIVLGAMIGFCAGVFVEYDVMRDREYRRWVYNAGYEDGVKSVTAQPSR